MQRDLDELSRQTFDLVVVGGGIFGVSAALDAAQRGMRVALVERGDFGGATSAHSYKMIHGGIRYLQHADFHRIRHSARARSAFLRIAPHLTHPLPIVVPTYGSGMRSRPVLRAGMWLYDALTFDRNRGVVDPSRRIPRAAFLGRAEVIERYPGLPRDGLTGAGVFCDGQMYNPPRLVLAFVQSAAEAGAVVANYVEAVGLLGDERRVTGVKVVDKLSGSRFDVRTRLVLNAAGPYAENLLEVGLGRGLERRTPFSRDAYFIVPRPLLAGAAALTVPSRTVDPDALVSRGGRHLFLVPWRGVTMIGVWHKVHDGDPDAFEITEAELESWIGEINGAYPGLDLSVDDVMLGSAGLVPFGDNDPQARNLKFAHRSRVIDHATEQGVEGLITLIGVRYTTGPCEAVEVIDMVGRKLGRAAPSRLETTPLRGGRIDDFSALCREVQCQGGLALSDEVAEALAHNHGTEHAKVTRLIAARPALGECLPGSTVLRAEIVHAARDEMAMTLADVVFRRTDLCTATLPSDLAVEAAAALMGEVRGWPPERTRAECHFVRGRLRLARSGRAFLADGTVAAPTPVQPALVEVQ